MGARMRAIGALVAVSLLAAGVACSGGSENTAKGQPLKMALPAGVELDGPVRNAYVSAGGAVDLSAGSTDMTGTVETATGVRYAEVTVTDPPQEIDGIALRRVTSGLWVELDGDAVVTPFTVTLDVAELAEGETFGVARLNDNGTWEILEGTPQAGQRISVEIEHFSGIFGWIGDRVLKPIGDFMARSLGGRSSPSQCDPAPSWATWTNNPSGSTHSCVRTNRTEDGAEIAELEIKSNRGTYQWISLPELPREYVWVEGQPPSVRAAIARTFASGEAVLLPPGKRLTIGYRQPTEFTQIRFNSTVDNYTFATSAAHLLAEVALDKAASASILVVLTCTGQLSFDLGDFGSPVTLGSPEMMWPELARCVWDTLERLSDPKKAVAAAKEILGPDYNESQLTELSLTNFTLGKLAKLFGTAIRMGSYIFKEVAYISDSILAAMNPGRDNATTLTLEPPRRVAPPPAPPRESAELARCRQTGTAPIGAPDKFERTTRCLYAAWRGGDRDTAALFAEPAAIDQLFAFPPGAEWEFRGCEANPQRQADSWLGNVCTYHEPNPEAPHGVTTEFWFVAWDDVVAIDEVKTFG